MKRSQTREDISRALLAWGAFSASALVMRGDDERSLARLEALQAKLGDERGAAVRRLIRGLRRIQEQDGA